MNQIVLTHHASKGTLHHPSKYWVSLQWGEVIVYGAASKKQWESYDHKDLLKMCEEKGIFPADLKVVSSSPRGVGVTPKLRLREPTTVWDYQDGVLINLTAQKREEDRREQENKKWNYTPSEGEKFQYRRKDQKSVDGFSCSEFGVAELVKRVNPGQWICRFEDGTEEAVSLFYFKRAKLD